MFTIRSFSQCFSSLFDIWNEASTIIMRSTKLNQTWLWPLKKCVFWRSNVSFCASKALQYSLGFNILWYLSFFVFFFVLFWFVSLFLYTSSFLVAISNLMKILKVSVNWEEKKIAKKRKKKHKAYGYAHMKIQQHEL